MKRNFLVFLMVIIALMACKTDSDSDPECNCPIKSHLAVGGSCSCGLASCGCTVHEYGKVNGIPVYRTSAVSDAQMAGVLAKVQAGYDGVMVNKSNISTTKVSAIHMVDDEWAEFCEPDGKGKFIIKLGYQASSTVMEAALTNIANGPLITKLNLYENIRLIFCIKAEAIKVYG